VTAPAQSASAAWWTRPDANRFAAGIFLF